MVITTIFIIVIALIAALIPAIIWFILFSRKDIHPEPRRLLVYTFNFGVMISLAVLIFQVFYQNIIDMPTKSLISIVGLALIEEVLKFLSAFWAIHKNPEFDEPIDAMIYAMAAALGFATVENFFIILNIPNITEFITVSPVIFKIVSLRFIGATLLHVLASAIVGFFWAYGRKKNKIVKPIIIGLIIATAVHSIFNLLIYEFQNTNLWYPALFLVIVVFFVLIDFKKLKYEKNFNKKPCG
ncbi:MAG: PrsW family glutamic-type intramembrane protease [Patescibacteria group bacterium]|nr:PrsW family glutamic-type intramembrane protease [Patescibacteria group bacterium]